MKIRFLTILLGVICFTPNSYAQVDSTLINGEYYKIYPIRERIEIPNEYWIAVKDEAYFQDQENYFNVFGENQYFNRAEFDTANALVKGWLYEDLADRWKYRTKKKRNFRGRFVRAVRKNQASIVVPNYQMDVDILPAFSALPDGKYVQLFNDFCLVGKNGICEEQTDRVAVYFNLKDNLLHGEATWVDLDGDTLRTGYFEDGMRTGTWKFTEITFNRRYFNKWAVKNFVKDGARPADTSYFVKTYYKGELHGPYQYKSPRFNESTTGFFRNGEPSGNWQHFDNGVLISNYTYANSEDTILTHKPILRTVEPLNDKYDLEKFNIHGYRYERRAAPNDLVEFNFGNQEEIELEEEEFQSHELEYDNELYYEDYGYRGDHYMLEYPKRIMDRTRLDPYALRESIELFDIIKDPNRELYETRGYFLDSLGGRLRYTGVYERFYPNGQLFLRYNFENGQLVKEDTMFWDNGQAWDVIEFVADSSYYLRKVYDYDGKLMNTAIYDSLGDFLRYDIKVKPNQDFIYIDGVKAEKYFSTFYTFGYHDKSKNRGINNRLSEVYNGNYVYKNTISSDSIIPDTAISFRREYSGLDKKTLVNLSTFDPKTRIYKYTETSLTGVNYLNIERAYSEDYKSWTGKRIWKFGKFTVIETSSGVYNEHPDETDTVVRLVRIKKPYMAYNVSTDLEILKDGEPYTGKVKLRNANMFSRLSKNKLVMRTKNSRSSKVMKRRLFRYIKRGRNHELLGLVNSPNQLSYPYNDIRQELLQTANNYWFAAHNSHGNLYYRNNLSAAIIKGQYVEGKPQGYWYGKRKGKLTGEIQFERGEAFGTHKQYGFQEKASKYTRARSNDTLPTRKVYYLNATTEYKNGMRHGKHIDYTWYGEIETEGNFENDYQEGLFINRYKEAFTKAQYKNGFLDGYAQTYLTFPDMDTTLIYDLNFKDGGLNGESNAYHINGKLAKRGFFLNGEPIEDYEAFDTLGFRYHYVKFQYGFPVEEKIWEENQLSLRYRFDWQDSIYFDPSDLMQSQSLDRLLARYGYNQQTLQQEYFGRKRLVNKSGLNYHMTKFYPNDTIARIGRIDDGKKIGHWDFYDYDGVYLYKVNYKDSIIRLNDSILFKSKGLLTKYNANGDSLYKAHIIEKMEKYDCAHTDHYEIRQLYTVWEASDTLNRMNGYVRNYYDNGVLQNEGEMKDGLPTGLWKYYDPFGKLNLMGSFVQGKRDGRWLSGDLEKKKYLGEICLNPNLPDLEGEKKYRENLIDVTIVTYRLGKTVSKQFFDLNLNKYSDLIED